MENVRIDDDPVIQQDNEYSIAWEAESDLSILDNHKAYCDPVTIEHTHSLDSVI